ncbi:MAG: macro domain-containing protein [Bacilli bacterium]|nr:macro domain-containing protein [Bacilli bacterium]
MSFFIAKGNIFDQKVDAIVIPGAPHRRLEGDLGEQAKEICGQTIEMQLGQMAPINITECLILFSNNISAKHIIYCANPMYDNQSPKQSYSCLKKTYLNCMEKAYLFGLQSVAFPILSCGAYNFPIRKSILACLEAKDQFFIEHDLDICLVIYKDSTYKSYKELFEGYKVLSGHLFTAADKKKILYRERFSWYDEELLNVIKRSSNPEDFVAKLKTKIADKGIEKTKVFDGVITSTMFYRILNNEAKPNKYTVVGMGLNMGLTEFEINDLLVPLGFGLVVGYKKDDIIMQGLREHKNIDDINQELLQEGLPTI